MKDLVKLAVEVGAESYELGKRESYLNQNRYSFDESQLTKFAELLQASEPVQLTKKEVGILNSALRKSVKVIEASEPVANFDSEDTLRISKSGYSLKLGWTDKRIVAEAPKNECTPQWLYDAQRLCDGWNRTKQAQASEPVGGVFYLPNDKYPKATFNTLDIAEGSLLYTSPPNTQQKLDKAREALQSVLDICENGVFVWHKSTIEDISKEALKEIE
jgi:hypothetical protein